MTTNRERLGFDPRVLLGKSEIEAGALAFQHGVYFDIVRRDGVLVPQSEDVKAAKRVEVEINKGHVVAFAYDSNKYRPE